MYKFTENTRKSFTPSAVGTGHLREPILNVRTKTKLDRFRLRRVVIRVRARQSNQTIDRSQRNPVRRFCRAKRTAANGVERFSRRTAVDPVAVVPFRKFAPPFQTGSRIPGLSDGEPLPAALDQQPFPTSQPADT